MEIALIILLVLVVLGVVVSIIFYNNLVKARIRVDEAWSDIKVQLKRRYDLIPNLVETVKGYATHEEKTLQEVIEARNLAMAGAENADPKAMLEKENVLSGALKSLFAVSENYPDLKANTNFLELQRELTDTEDKIQASRRFYNMSVRDLNIRIETFPSSIFASTFGFVKREFFEIDEAETANPQVKF